MKISRLCPEAATGATNKYYEKCQKDECAFLIVGTAINNNGELLNAELVPVNIKNGKNINRFIVQPGDVVLMSKGSSIRVALVDNNIPKKPVIVSANFVLLRPLPKYVKGEVLVAYFNSNNGQKALQDISSGSVLKVVNLSKLKNLDFPIPNSAEQEKIANLFHARNNAYRAAVDFIDKQYLVATLCIDNLIGEGNCNGAE